jgi:hypothetical protein
VIEACLFIDVAIPAIIGIVVLRPKALFVGSRATRPSRSPLDTLRGTALLFVAARYLVIKLIAR